MSLVSAGWAFAGLCAVAGGLLIAAIKGWGR